MAVGSISFSKCNFSISSISNSFTNSFSNNSFSNSFSNSKFSSSNLPPLSQLSIKWARPHLLW